MRDRESDCTSFLHFFVEMIYLLIFHDTTTSVHVEGYKNENTKRKKKEVGFHATAPSLLFLMLRSAAIFFSSLTAEPGAPLNPRGPFSPGGPGKPRSPFGPGGPVMVVVAPESSPEPGGPGGPLGPASPGSPGAP